MIGQGHAELAAGAIGLRLAAWRERRGLTVDDFADDAGLDTAWVAAVERGQDWIDRRTLLAAASAALHLDPTELTGQPYAPAGADQAVVQEAAFRLRHVAMDVPGIDQGRSASVDDLAARTAEVRAVEAAGDELGLARALPELIRLADAAVAGAGRGDRERAAELRAAGHAAAAGLLRRLGYLDLAWTLLHRAHPGTAPTLAALVEEARLLIDLGLPEYALARLERAEAAEGVDEELPLLAALAHAMAGRPEQAEHHLADAAAREGDSDQSTAVAAARAAVAVESGDYEAAAECLEGVDYRCMPSGRRVEFLVMAAIVDARHGAVESAAARLSEAEAVAPLRFRLDPFARELLAVLPARAATREVSEALRHAGERAGLR